MIGASLNGRSCFPFLSAKGGPAVIHAGGPIFRHRISCDKSACGTLERVKSLSNHRISIPETPIPVQ
jgi:hypothetical protein